MAKGFFMGWPMWEKLTFVLACAIFVTVLCAVAKLGYNHWRLRKYTALEKEKREQSMQRQMSQRQRPHGQAGVDDVPFGVRAIESGIEVEGVWISRPNTPDSQSGQSSPSSLPPKQHVQRVTASDLEKGLTKIQTVGLENKHRVERDRSASDSTNMSATPASAGYENRGPAGGMHDSRTSHEYAPDAGITKPPKTRHPPCSYNKYGGSPAVYRHSSVVNTLEGLEAIHRASTNVNADGGSGSSESGSGGDDPGPISAAAPALLSNEQSSKRPRHQSADLIMLDTHRISQAAETGQLTPKVRRPGQSRDSSVASIPQSATTPTDYFDYFASRQRQSLQNGAEVTSPTNPLSSPKIDALPVAVRRSSMPDVTPFAKFCQTAPPSPSSPRFENNRPISQDSVKTARRESTQSRYYAAPATPLASNPSTPPLQAQPAQQGDKRTSFERRESQVLRGHGSGFEILKRGSFPTPAENPLERQKAVPPVSLHNMYGRSRSRSTGQGNKLQKKRRPRPGCSEVTTAAGTSELLDTPAVLAVDRNATLTLGTDALIVLDEGLRHRRSAKNCCGLLPQLSKTTRAIPFYNVLWAELKDFEVSIQYAQPNGKKGCRVGSVHYTVTDKSLHAHTKRWVEALMERAYPAKVKRRKRMKVLINPFGGQGNAQKLWTSQIEPIISAARCEVDVEKTTHRGHAVEIAENLDVDAYDVVACASGDGTPHEVFNGLAKQKEPRRALRKVAVALLPCGSGNAMSLNLNGTDSPSLAAVAIVKGARTPLDLMAVTQGKERYYSFLSQAVGIIAESDLGTESLRWMGSFRFTWGILVRMLGKTTYPAEVSVVAETADKHAIRESYRHTVGEIEAAAAKQIHDIDDCEETLETGDTNLPPLKYGTVIDPLPAAFETQDMPTLGNFYVGNMYWMSPDAAFFAAALPSDGRADMINIDAMIPKSTILRMLLSVENGTLIEFPETIYKKILAYRITPRVQATPPKRRLRAKIGRWLGGAGKQKEGLIAVDGEKVPFEPFQVEVLPGLGTTLSKRGALYEFEKNPLVK